MLGEMHHVSATELATLSNQHPIQSSLNLR